VQCKDFDRGVDGFDRSEDDDHGIGKMSMRKSSNVCDVRMSNTSRSVVLSARPSEAKWDGARRSWYKGP
jgi:hypothetical protein